MSQRWAINHVKMQRPASLIKFLGIEGSGEVKIFPPQCKTHYCIQNPLPLRPNSRKKCHSGHDAPALLLTDLSHQLSVGPKAREGSPGGKAFSTNGSATRPHVLADSMVPEVSV